MLYENTQTIDSSEGVISICPLKSIPNSFACGTSKGKIQIYSKKDEYEYSKIGESQENDGGINVLIELKKTEKYLLSGSNDKYIKIWTIESSGRNNDDNINYRLSCKKNIIRFF